VSRLVTNVLKVPSHRRDGLVCCFFVVLCDYVLKQNITGTKQSRVNVASSIAKKQRVAFCCGLYMAGFLY
jgi:hypothetical protein